MASGVINYASHSNKDSEPSQSDAKLGKKITNTLNQLSVLLRMTCSKSS